jgi:DMSO reductase anchor subunit
LLDYSSENEDLQPAEWASERFGFWLAVTIILGMVFLFCQAFEYRDGLPFTWHDNLFGSIFFITTGFHGLHVTIGTLALLFAYLRFLATNVVCDYIDDLMAQVCQGDKTYVAGRTKFDSLFKGAQHTGFEAAA